MLSTKGPNRAAKRSKRPNFYIEKMVGKTDVSRPFTKGSSTHAKEYPKKDESRLAYKKGGKVKKGKK